MPKELVCFVEPFVMSWRVVDTNEPWETHVTSETVINAFTLCEERGATVFHIVGTQPYVDSLAEMLNKYQMVNYNENKIKIEVN